MDPFLITSDYKMQKTLSFMPGMQKFTHGVKNVHFKNGVQRLSLSVSMEPNFLVFEPIPMILNDVKLLVEALLI